MSSDLWFPSSESQQVVGRFVDVESDNPAESRKQGKLVRMLRPALETKVVGSHDISVQVVKPFNELSLRTRFPGAWEHYEAKKKGSKPVDIQPIDGIPIEDATFIGKEKMAWLKMQGLMTIEQLATLSDAQMQNLGHGARTWKKKAGQMLSDRESQWKKRAMSA